ncbi:MAG: sensor domain-containing diguanylate cyclase [Proteobacteria bacterium]|nr:sensor domain-containing diguanylate cyclase [Pseudomonadota bacterium]
MNKPDIPGEEQARLEALWSLGILDTPTEERFDRLTRMAKRIFDVPIALVSLVDEDRQWFKSCQGLEVRETSRDVSFCHHAIKEDGPLIVPDALEDARFSSNSLVTHEPKIRFYAGCPIKAVNGYKLGTLCIIDQKPRYFTGDDIKVLVDLASMVEREVAVMQLATMDELTNVSNRRGFMMLSEHALQLGRRQNLPISLVFMDLDKFKLVNDMLGHAEGDRVLISFARQMKRAYRDSDILARLGGDEFAALLINTTKEKAEEAVTRLRQLVRAAALEANRGYDILFSAGVVEFIPEQHDSIDALLADGDLLMYETKQSGRAN